jgi:chemotaxis protein MotB
MPILGRSKQSADSGCSWLTTFGDMVTLLFTFFVLVYSFCAYNPGEWETAAGSIKGALAAIPGTKGTRLLPGGGSGSLPSHLGVVPLFSEIRASDEDRERFVQEELSKIRDAMGGLEGIEIEETRTGYIFRVATPILFEIGTSHTKSVAKPFLTAIGRATYKTPATIIITGHTCDLPISTQDFKSNWELSARRATNVLRVIQGAAGPGTRFVALARGPYSPLVANRDELCRTRNRRVEIRFDLEGGLPFESRNEYESETEG